MRSLLIVIIYRVDCRKCNLAGRTLTNLSLFSQFDDVVCDSAIFKKMFSLQCSAKLLEMEV